MKPLPIAVVLLAAALAGWWLLDPGPGDEEGPDLAGEDPPSTSGAETRPPEQVPASAPEAGDPPTPGKQGDASSERPKGAWRVPLSDKTIARASWTEENAVMVLEQLAEAAGKTLSIPPVVRKRLERTKVTLDLGSAPVSRVLDLVLKPHYLGWNVRGDTLLVFDDDD